MEITEFINGIESKEDFLKFIELLRISYNKDKDKWENDDLSSYLDGIHGFMYDIDGYRKNHGGVTDFPTWKLFAKILLAGAIYE